MPDTVTLTNARDLPPLLDVVRPGETPEQAAARYAAATGRPAAVYRVCCGGPGSTFVGEKREEGG